VRICGASDSISPAATLNRFAYANDDPVNTMDPLGLDGFMSCMNDMVRWSFDGGKTWSPWYASGSVTCVGGGGGGSQIGVGGIGNNGGGGGNPKDRNKKKGNKQESEDCKKARENLSHLLEEEHNEIQASAHALGRDVAIGAAIGCGIEGLPALLILGPEAGAAGCFDGGVEMAVVGAGVWGVGALWDSFLASRAQAKAQQEVDAKCH